MKMCEFCQIGNYSENCICTKFNDVCPLVRRCNERHVWLPLDSMDKCTRRTIAIERKEDVRLNAGEYLVEYIQNGKLYINVDGCILRIANPFDYEPQKVKLKETTSGFEIDMDEDKEVVEEIKEEQPKEDTYKKSKKKK